MPFWRALRGLQGRYAPEEWRARWTSETPWDALDRLTEHIRARGLIA